LGVQFAGESGDLLVGCCGLACAGARSSIGIGWSSPALVTSTTVLSRFAFVPNVCSMLGTETPAAWAMLRIDGPRIAAGHEQVVCRGQDRTASALRGFGPDGRSVRAAEVVAGLIACHARSIRYGMTIANH
jgi:hypothetical protein